MKDIKLYLKELKDIVDNLNLSKKLLIERIDKIEKYIMKDCYSKKIKAILHEWKYLKLNSKDIILNINNINNFYKNIHKKSNTYTSTYIKKLIIKELRNKHYIAEEFSISRYRFDILALSKFGKNKLIKCFEIKTSLNDLRQDKKFEKYLNYSNLLYFVVPQELEKDTLNKIHNSKYSKHMGLFIVENNKLNLRKKAFSNNKNFDINSYKEAIFENIYNKYIYNI